MPEPRRPQGGRKLQAEAFVESVVPDPSQPQDAVILNGYLGRSNREGYWRLYLTPELNQYVEVAEADVLHSQTLTPEQSPLGGTMLWVRRDASVQHAQTASQQVQAQFLQGDLTQTYMAGAGFGMAGTGTEGVAAEGIAAAPISVAICPSLAVVCHQTPVCLTRPVWCRPTRPIVCRSIHWAQCPTRPTVCGCTFDHGCLTRPLICQPTPRCPSRVDACPTRICPSQICPSQICPSIAC